MSGTLLARRRPTGGERRRDNALQLLRERRAVLVRLAQRAFLTLLLDRGPLTSDLVRTCRSQSAPTRAWLALQFSNSPSYWLFAPLGPARD
jgi:hypothetical protein